MSKFNWEEFKIANFCIACVASICCIMPFIAGWSWTHGSTTDKFQQACLAGLGVWVYVFLMLNLVSWAASNCYRSSLFEKDSCKKNSCQEK